MAHGGKSGLDCVNLVEESSVVGADVSYNVERFHP